jgi:ribonuclease BN (tRNA processing enzyme)
MISFIPGQDGPILNHSSGFKARKGEITVRNMKYYFHPKNGSHIYKVSYNDKNLVFATDIEEYDGGDARLAEFAAGADVLIHDAQYLPIEADAHVGWGHSTYVDAARAAQAAGVRELVLTSHNPDRSDMAVDEMVERSRELFRNTEAARPGLEIPL